MEKYVLAFDQGTTSSRAIVFNHQGSIVASCSREFAQYYPKPGWVEHNPLEIWDSQISSARQAVNEAGITPGQIACIGITNQRETTIVWDKETGKPVYNAIVWQCRRTSYICDELKDKGYTALIKKKTGLLIDAYFSGTKLKWILDNVEGAREKAEKGQLLFGTVDSYLIWNLTGGRVHVTDYTNASRTMLFNINTLCWDDEILELLGVPKQMLPQVKPSSCVYGYTSKGIFGEEIAISGDAGDQQSALFGQGCFKEGEAKNTYGTGCFLLMNTGNKPVVSENGLITTIAWGIGGSVEYALEGSVFVAGAVVKWLRDEMCMIKSAQETCTLAQSVKDTNGVYIVPAFTGMGAPYWDMYARGTVVGLTRGAGRAHFVRAALEAIAYQTMDVLRCMQQDSAIPLNSLKVDGGACANDFLMSFQADILSVPVERPKVIETTALGAAYLAGLAVGYWESREDIIRNRQIDKTFQPNMEYTKIKQLVEGWHKAISRARDWAEQ